MRPMAFPVFLLICGHLGCSSDGGGPPQPDDVLAPEPIGDLVVTRTGPQAADLEWTAPAEDAGAGGAVATYDLRYRLGGLDAAGFEDAAPASGLPAPAEPGTRQHVRILGLLPDTLYGAAMRSRDDAGNASGLSEIVLFRTRTDTIPPASIFDLRVLAPDSTSVALAWTAPAEDGTEGSAVSAYDLRYSTQGLDAGIWDTSPRGEGLPEPRSPGEEERYVLTELLPGATYTIGIRSEDASGNRSALSNLVRVFTAPPDTVPPGAITDLAVIDSTSSTLTLRFTLTGDDGRQGTASSVDLRYRVGMLDADTWSDATPVAPAPDAGPPGTEVLPVIGGLEAETRYGVGVRLRDEAGNESDPIAFAHAATRPRPGYFLAPRGLDADPRQRQAYVVADSAAGIVYRGGLLGPPVALASIAGVVGVRDAGTNWLAVAVEEVLASGSLWSFSASSQAPVRLADGFGVPADLDVSETGEIYILERSGGRILRYGADGGGPDVIPLPDLSIGSGLAVAASGTIYFGGIGSQDGLPVIGSRSDDGAVRILHHPHAVADVARDRDGLGIWYLDAARDALLRLPFEGGDPETLAVGLRRAVAVAPTVAEDPLGPGFFYSNRDGDVQRRSVRP